ncbi:hypothetical protein Maes01_01241 [Microbulbifer aestuariivivens]|uniref:DUF2489 domain-containing protein n=1 Tax=Microbulbifer aestuariivivens TaxID=1908308 RepID=A0ABP9WNI9_9GAMM
MPEWLEIGVSVAFAIAAVFFFGKYREKAAALHESERMKARLSNDLNRYRDVKRLRALRDALLSDDILPVDDEGREHLLLRDGDMRLHHLVLRRQCNAIGEGESPTYLKDGQELPVTELQ